MGDNGKNAGQPTMGTDVPVENVSDEGLPEPGVRPTRTLRRDPLGRFAGKPLPHRTPVMAGPLGGYDAVIGQRPEGWIPGVERVHAVRPDYSGYPAISRMLDDGKYCLRRTV